MVLIAFQYTVLVPPEELSSPGLVSSSRKVQSHQKREPLSGFFFQQKYNICRWDITTISYIAVEKQDVEVHQTVFNFLPEPVVVLASYNGLVCCRSCFIFRDPCFYSCNPLNKDFGGLCLYICNPLNKEWIRLKWDEPDIGNSFGLALGSSRDPIGTSNNFKLIRVVKSRKSNVAGFSFDIYSSDIGAWKESEEICRCYYNLYKNSGIFVEGVLHWLTDGVKAKVLTFNVERELSWLVSVPLPSTEFVSIPEACIGDSEGKLHYILISEYGLHVWFLEDIFESRWSLKLSKTLEELEVEHSDFFCNLREKATQRLAVNEHPWIDPLAFKDGNLLMRHDSMFFLYNIYTNKMKKLCELNKLGTGFIRCAVVPFSSSLVPLNQA
ncbi:hypothetical protein COLO4_11599 [Corchorus olitorius]|uniref:F-box protein At3g26010-like beta-propeller domain-containing protein n=1 Tax=Corchorus olitorius TaxID=93759 RepID=A0A1R3K3W9_9ROSI|nr:hypothetical protein COLO4_11599 [Corchorus olitorius]